MAETNTESKTKALGMKQILMPVVATVVSAAASYFAKKAPQYLEETVLPKLREARDGAGGATRDLPARAKETVQGAADVAQDVAHRARSVVGGDSDGGGGGTVRRRDTLSAGQLERRRQERAQHRAERRKTAKA
jgi:hypothetical protein